MSDWYYLSFVDPDKPEGSRWAGACCVRGRTPTDAVGEAWRQACNPGGEVAIIGPLPEPPGGAEMCNRLLSRHEAEHLYDGMEETV